MTSSLWNTSNSNIVHTTIYSVTLCVQFHLVIQSLKIHSTQRYSSIFNSFTSKPQVSISASINPDSSLSRMQWMLAWKPQTLFVCGLNSSQTGVSDHGLWRTFALQRKPLFFPPNREFGFANSPSPWRTADRVNAGKLRLGGVQIPQRT